MTAFGTHLIAIKTDEKTKNRVKHLFCCAVANVVISDVRSHYTVCRSRGMIGGFRQDALQAWADYNEAGSLVAVDEAVRWLESWVGDNEKPVPTCQT